MLFKATFLIDQIAPTLRHPYLSKYQLDLPQPHLKLSEKDTMPRPSPNVCRWLHYSQRLEDAVEFYNSGGGGRVPIGTAFVTAHSMLDAAMTGSYRMMHVKYREKQEPFMTQCHKQVGRPLT